MDSLALVQDRSFIRLKKYIYIQSIILKIELELYTIYTYKDAYNLFFCFFLEFYDTIKLVNKWIEKNYLRGGETHL